MERAEDTVDQPYEGKVKSYSLAYNRCETRDKRPLGRDPDRSWCHRYTTSMIKLFWSQSMAPWALAAVYGLCENLSA